MPICNLSDLPQLLTRNQCLLGLDYGTKIIGVAVSDPGLRVASPLLSLVRKKFTQDAQILIQLMRERDIGALVVGLPRDLEGEEGPMAQAARAFAHNLMRHPDRPFADLPVAFWDERFSTAAVERFLISDDMSRKRRSEVIDKAAAAYMLQGALDALEIQGHV